MAWASRCHPYKVEQRYFGERLVSLDHLIEGPFAVTDDLTFDARLLGDWEGAQRENLPQLSDPHCGASVSH